MIQAEGPTVTMAARCERAPFRASAVSPAGITTQLLSSGFRAELQPSEDSTVGLKQTDTLRGQPTQPLSVGGNGKHRGQRLIGVVSNRSFAFFQMLSWGSASRLLQLFLPCGLSTNPAPEPDSVCKQCNMRL